MADHPNLLAGARQIVTVPDFDSKSRSFSSLVDMWHFTNWRGEEADRMKQMRSAAEVAWRGHCGTLHAYCAPRPCFCWRVPHAKADCAPREARSCSVLGLPRPEPLASLNTTQQTFAQRRDLCCLYQYVGCLWRDIGSPGSNLGSMTGRPVSADPTARKVHPGAAMPHAGQTQGRYKAHTCH